LGPDHAELLAQGNGWRIVRMSWHGAIVARGPEFDAAAQSALTGAAGAQLGSKSTQAGACAGHPDGRWPLERNQGEAS